MSCRCDRGIPAVVSRATITLVTIVITCVFTPLVRSESRLEFAPVLLIPGQAARVPLRATTDFHLQGFSLSARYDADLLDVEAVDFTGRVLETVDPDFVEFSADARTSSLIIGVLVVATPPFDDRLIPGVGIPLDLLDLVVRPRADVEAASTSLRFVDGLGEPAISNRFVVENRSIPPEQLVDVELEILDRDVVVSERPFVRGDVNQDREIDMADPITLLGFLYLGKANLFCEDGADANDDEKIDISDCVYLLGFLFIGTEAPRSPHPDKGLDLSGNGRLGCSWSNYGLFP